PERIEKTWGYELIYAATSQYAGKILFIKRGEALSLQYHKRKEESLYIYDGSVEFVTIDKATASPVTLVLKEGEGIHIRPGMQHRLTALRDTTVLEVSTPDLDR